MPRLLAILDCARTPDYLPAMLESAGDFAAWTGPRLMCWSGPEPRAAPPGWDLLQRARDGTQPALWSVFRHAHTRGCDLLVVENDIELAPGAVPVLEQTRCPDDCDLLTFFDGTEVLQPVAIPEVRRIPFVRRGEKGRFAGTQCVLFPLRTLGLLINSPMAERWDRRPFGDKLIGRILGQDRDATGTFGVFLPNLVQHRGEVSSYGHEGCGFLKSYTFTGQACTHLA